MSLPISEIFNQYIYISGILGLILLSIFSFFIMHKREINIITFSVNSKLGEGTEFVIILPKNLNESTFISSNEDIKQELSLVSTNKAS